MSSKAKSYKAKASRKHTVSVRLAFNDGPAEEAELSPRESFKVDVYLPILDRLYAELNKCLDAYTKQSQMFGFLHNVLHPEAKNGEALSKRLHL